MSIKKSEIQWIVMVLLMGVSATQAQQQFAVNSGRGDGTSWLYTITDKNVTDTTDPVRTVDGQLNSTPVDGSLELVQAEYETYTFEYDKGTKQLVDTADWTVVHPHDVGAGDVDASYWAVEADYDLVTGDVLNVTEVDLRSIQEGDLGDPLVGQLVYDPANLDHQSITTLTEPSQAEGNLLVGGDATIDGTLTVDGVDISQVIEDTNTQLRQEIAGADDQVLIDAGLAADAGDAQVLIDAGLVADAGDAQVLIDAGLAADAGDAQVLIDAGLATDAGDAQVLIDAGLAADAGDAQVLIDAGLAADAGDAQVLIDAGLAADAGDAQVLIDAGLAADAGDAQVLIDAGLAADAGDAQVLTDLAGAGRTTETIKGNADDIDAEVLARIATDTTLEADIDAMTDTGLVDANGNNIELGANEVGIAGIVTLDTVTSEIHIGENSLVTVETDSDLDGLTDYQSLYARANTDGNALTAPVDVDMHLGGTANVIVNNDLTVGNDIFAGGDLFVNGRTQGVQSQVDQNRSLINRNAGNIDQNTRGIAMAAALSQTTVLPGMDNALDVNAATFAGETGLAITYSRRVNENVQVNFGAATTTDLEDSIVRAGIGVQW